MDQSSLMDLGCDLQDPETEVPQSESSQVEEHLHKVFRKLHSYWPSKPWEQEGCFHQLHLLNTPMVPLMLKGKKQNPESKPGTDHTVGHTHLWATRGEMLQWMQIFHTSTSPHEISVDSSPREAPGSLCFEKCISWPPGTEQRPTASSSSLHSRLLEMQQLLTPDSALLLCQTWHFHSLDKPPHWARTIHLNQDLDASSKADFCTSFEEPVSFWEALLTPQFL